MFPNAMIYPFIHTYIFSNHNKGTVMISIRKPCHDHLSFPWQASSESRPRSGSYTGSYENIPIRMEDDTNSTPRSSWLSSFMRGRLKDSTESSQDGSGLQRVHGTMRMRSRDSHDSYEGQMFRMSLDDTPKWVHDEDITWKCFPHCWPFVRGIDQSSVDWFPYKGPVMQILMFSLF